MNILAVICEYNPFHKGHLYQLKTHRALLRADGVVCLMSGSFVQRGAPAVFDKWTRAKAAVMCGADLVLELPVVYSAQSAMRFAAGAVSLLNELVCVNYLSFGSECGNIQLLQNAEPVVFSDEFARLVCAELKKGISYPAARLSVAKNCFPALSCDLLSSPNNILALEYVHALARLKSAIQPVTLKRNDSFASASQIRDMMEQGRDISEFVPNKAAFHTTPNDKSVFDQLVSYQFRRETPESLKTIADVSEGLEHRFIKFAKTSFGAEELATQVKTKRYTRTRIDRIIVNTLLGITSADTELPPQYARVLAFNKRGTQILKEMGRTSAIPIITKTADAVSAKDDFWRMFKKDLLATDIYALMTDNKQAGQDFKTSPIYVK